MRRRLLNITREDLLVFLTLLFCMAGFIAALIAAFFDPYGQHEDVTGMTLILLTTAALMFYVALLIERREDDHPMSYEHQAAGFHANMNGKQLEAMIRASLAYYRAKGIADCEKTPEPVRQITKMDGSGRFRAIYEKKAQPDFSGTYYGGYSVVFEAKNTQQKSIRQDRVTSEQAATMERAWDLGAIVFVLVSFELSRFYRVPWYAWRDMEQLFGKKSVNEQDLKNYRLPTSENGSIRIFDDLDGKFFNHNAPGTEGKRTIFPDIKF